jgi:hypothetical protein
MNGAAAAGPDQRAQHNRDNRERNTSSREPAASGPALSWPFPIETRGDEESCEFQAGEYSWPPSYRCFLA